MVGSQANAHLDSILLVLLVGQTLASLADPWLEPELLVHRDLVVNLDLLHLYLFLITVSDESLDR
jgi:hypothetical protein